MDSIIPDESQAELFKKYMGQIEFFFAECNTCYTVEQISKLSMINERYVELSYWKSYKIKYINSLKEELLSLLSKSVEDNQLTTKNKYIR